MVLLLVVCAAVCECVLCAQCGDSRSYGGSGNGHDGFSSLNYWRSFLVDVFTSRLLLVCQVYKYIS